MRFVDTSFWYALQQRRDPQHHQARDIVRKGPGRLLTTNLVLGETWTLVRRRNGHAAAVGFLDRVGVLPELTVTPVAPETEDQAWQWLRRHDEREYSFVDATSFMTMRARRVREALAFDGAFTAAGFVEIHG